MNKTFMQLLEISEIKSAQGKIEELDRFIDVTRGFSLKCNSHLRVLANLVNNLVESEDWLELTESSLRLPESSSKEKSVKQPPLTSKTTPTLAEQVLGTLKEDYDRIAKHIEGGRETSEFLKQLLEKLLTNANVQSNTNNTTEIRHEKKIIKSCNKGHSPCPVHGKDEKSAEKSEKLQKDRPLPREHGALTSGSLAKTQLFESAHNLKGGESTWDPLKRPKMSVHSEFKAFENRNRGDFDSALNTYRERVGKLEKELADANDLIGVLQTELIKLKLENKTLEEIAREILSVKLGGETGRESHNNNEEESRIVRAFKEGRRENGLAQSQVIEKASSNERHLGNLRESVI